MKAILALTALGAMASCATADGPWKEFQPVPEFVGSTWHNSDKPLTIAGLKGKVVLVHFWTFGCINCKHNLPTYSDWQKQFGDKGLQVIGVHTPETAEERVSSKVDDAIARWGIKYPVLTDNSGKNWNRWGLRYWPTVFLVDKQGRVRDVWEGELEYNHAGGTAKIAKEIKTLLAEG
jgi:thiol-disulfide isomerase/thioredoxin